MLVWSGSSSQYLSGSKHQPCNLAHSVLEPQSLNPLSSSSDFLIDALPGSAGTVVLAFVPALQGLKPLIPHSAPLGWDSVACHGIFLTPTTYLLHFLLLGLPEDCNDWINMLTSQIPGLRLSLYNILSNGLFRLVPGTPWLLTMARLPSNQIFQPHSACTCPNPNP